VINGDFEQALTTGWTQSAAGTNWTITRGTNYHPDADYEAYCYKYGYSTTGSGHAILYQVVDIPSTAIEFSAAVRLYAWDNHTSAWSGAALILTYMDASSAYLGETRICRRSVGCPWAGSATMHIIEASDTSWHNYSFTLNDELANLSAVNPDDVAKIKVSLHDTTASC
jgi:hypothetical protein